MQRLRVICPWLLFFLEVVRVGKSQNTAHSVCSSHQYRGLPVMLQMEHQCLVLEKLQTDFDRETQVLHDQYQNLYNMVHDFQEKMYRNIESLTSPSRGSQKAIPVLKDVPLARDCNELLMNGVTLSGVYPVRLPNRNIVNVWCDMVTDNGGWTLIQRRVDGSTNFSRLWDDYAFGFGNANLEYWLGNDNLYWLTSYKDFSIRFDLWDWEGNRAYALYDKFQVASETSKYKLTISDYSGDAGDAMIGQHNNMAFSTVDRDYDKWSLECAVKDQAGWWYNSCGQASLNGQYLTNGQGSDGLSRGIVWYPWKQNHGYSLKRTEIKIKPTSQVKLDRETKSTVTPSITTTTTTPPPTPTFVDDISVENDIDDDNDDDNEYENDDDENDDEDNDDDKSDDTE